MAERHPQNTPDHVVRRCMGEVAVPLCATLGPGAASLGPCLDFVDLALLKANSCASQPKPEMLNLALDGCKRRDQRATNAKPTTWVLDTRPRSQTRTGPGASPGST